MTEDFPILYRGRGLADTVCRSAVSFSDEAVDEALVILSAEERARAARFRFAEDRASYVTAHALLRRTLSEIAPLTAPNEWAFSATPEGRPFIAGPARGTNRNVSLSHARGRVGVLVSTAGRCGVDVERVGRVADPLGLAASVFSKTEVSDLFALSGTARDEHFCALWCLKEAYLKAEGVGLGAPLDNFCFRLDTLTGTPAEVRLPPGVSEASWAFRLYRPGSAHFLAAALRLD